MNIDPESNNYLKLHAIYSQIAYHAKFRDARFNAELNVLFDACCNSYEKMSHEGKQIWCQPQKYH